jgi:hypothetical protein
VGAVAAGHRALRWSGACLAALLALALGAPRAAGAAVTLEDVVGKHLRWLEATDNYLAEIRTSGLQTGRLGTVFVDNTTMPAEAYFEGAIDFPSQRRRTLEIAGTDTSARAAMDDRAAAWALPKTPFKQSFSMFERGLSVDEAIRRVREIDPNAAVVENPVGGLNGLRVTPNQDFLTRVDGMLESLLLGGSLPRGVDTTIWFNADGRIERMVLAEGTQERLITTLHYLGTNLAASRARKYRRPIEMRGRSQVYPTLLEMLLAIKQDDASAPAPDKK